MDTKWRELHWLGIRHNTASMERAAAADAARVRAALGESTMIAPLVEIVLDYRGADGRVVWNAAGNYEYDMPRKADRDRVFCESLFYIYIAVRGIRGCAPDESLYDCALRCGLVNHMRYVYSVPPILGNGDFVPSRMDIGRVYADAIAAGYDDVAAEILARPRGPVTAYHVPTYHHPADFVWEVLSHAAIDEKKAIAAVRAAVESFGLPSFRYICRRPLSATNRYVLAMAFHDRFRRVTERERVSLLYTMKHCAEPRNIDLRMCSVILSGMTSYNGDLLCFTCGVEAPAGMPHFFFRGATAKKKSGGAFHPWHFCCVIISMIFFSVPPLWRKKEESDVTPCLMR